MIDSIRVKMETWYKSMLEYVEYDSTILRFILNQLWRLSSHETYLLHVYLVYYAVFMHLTRSLFNKVNISLKINVLHAK